MTTTPETRVTPAMVNAAWNRGKDLHMTGLPTDFRQVLEAAMAVAAPAAPAPEVVAWYTPARQDAIGKLPRKIHFGSVKPSLWGDEDAIALVPLTTPRDLAADNAVEGLFAAAWAEAEKAMRRFPQPNYVISKVAEEAGEVVKAAIHCAEGREQPEAVVAEIRQAMAMLIRLYVEGDQVHGLPSLIPSPPDPEGKAEDAAHSDKNPPSHQHPERNSE